MTKLCGTKWHTQVHVAVRSPLTMRSFRNLNVIKCNYRPSLRHSMLKGALPLNCNKILLHLKRRNLYNPLIDDCVSTVALDPPRWKRKEERKKKNNIKENYFDFIIETYLYTMLFIFFVFFLFRLFHFGDLFLFISM